MPKCGEMHAGIHQNALKYAVVFCVKLKNEFLENDPYTFFDQGKCPQESTLMTLEGFCPHKVLSTCRTSMWHLLCVYPCMRYQCSQFPEALLTGIALVWLLSCVYSLMLFQGFRPLKCVATTSAFVWSLVCVQFAFLPGFLFI